MRAFIREKILEELIDSAKLITEYQQKSPDFVVNTIRWCQSLEEFFIKIRHPASGIISSERGKLLAVMEGYKHEESPSQHSKRKAAAFQALESIEVINQNLHQVMIEIDTQFNAWREKVAQLIAITSSKHPIEIQGQEITNAALKHIWNQLGKNQETINMFQYLSAAIPQTDLFYLLRDIMINFLSNTKIGDS